MDEQTGAEGDRTVELFFRGKNDGAIFFFVFVDAFLNKKLNLIVKGPNVSISDVSYFPQHIPFKP